MRLINVETLDLEEYSDDDRPEYAILSHTWTKEEVTLQEWQSTTRPTQKLGYNKIVRACQQAKIDRLRYLWCDTNCIDKKSSADISEAINSMFNWYRDAAGCYGYLSDVSRREEVATSRWMTRGWTLQELLAPRTMMFFSSDWTPLGSRTDLRAELQVGTSIPNEYLTGKSMFAASIAQRMSWLSRRRTTRIEDMAYCMLGIFDINLPPLYGEGPKAFLRLQEEIIRVTSDQTIFCWTWIPEHVPENWGSLLAPSPHVFAAAHDCIPFTSNVMSHDRMPETYTIANGNLLISLRRNHAYMTRFVSFNAARMPREGPGAGFLSIPVTGTHRSNPAKNRWIRTSYPPTPIVLKPKPGQQPKQLVSPSKYISQFELKPFGPLPRPDATIKYGLLLIFDDGPSCSRLRPGPMLNISSHWEPERSLLYLEHLEDLCVSRGAISFSYTSRANAQGTVNAGRLITAFLAAKPKEGGGHEFSCSTLRLRDTGSSTQRAWMLRGDEARRQVDELTDAALRGRLSNRYVWNDETHIELDGAEQFTDANGTVVQVARFEVKRHVE